MNGAVTGYVVSGSRILRQTTGPAVLDFYYDEAGRAIGFRTGNADYWYAFNLQGDVTGIVNASGTEVVSYTYDAWGRPLTTTGAMANTIGAQNPFRYRGYCYDTETGLYYLNTRYYDPAVGRFVSADGIITDVGDSVSGTNLYSYCLNDPVNSADNDGRIAIYNNMNAIASQMKVASPSASSSSPRVSPTSSTVSVAGSTTVSTTQTGVQSTSSTVKKPTVASAPKHIGIVYDVYDDSGHEKAVYIEAEGPSMWGFGHAEAGLANVRINSEYGGLTVTVLDAYVGLDPFGDGIGATVDLFTVSLHVNTPFCTIEVTGGVGAGAVGSIGLGSDNLGPSLDVGTGVHYGISIKRQY